MIFVISKARYYSGVLGFFTLAVALGVVVCWRRSRVLGAVLLAALLFLDGRGVPGYLHSEWRPFSITMEHILERARAGEPVVYTYHWDRYLDLYYDSAELPAIFMPSGETPTTVEAAEAGAHEVLSDMGSAWLVMYPSKLEPEIVEAGFNGAGFPTETTWFPGDRGVLRYFAERPLTERSGGIVWGDQFRLNRWWTSEARVAAGDALRLQFEWENLAPRDETGQVDEDEPQPLVHLTLVGPDGQTWATRLAAPCSASLGASNDTACKPAGWRDLALDRQAFYVPLHTPPGEYTLHIAWLTPDGNPMLARTPESDVPQAGVPLLDVVVDTPQSLESSEAHLAQPSGAATGDGGMTLVSWTQPQEPVLAGSTVVLPMQWQVHTPQPPLEARLELTRDGQAWSSTQPLGPAWYPSDQWMTGRLVLVQPEFRLPGTLAPGEYTASLMLNRAGDQASVLSLPLGPLVVKDRERLFAMPGDGEPAGVEWQEGIQLARVAAPQTAQAGETVPVTLIWRADRPTAGNWKVFIHLADATGTTQAQGDGYPQGGAALTPTWQAGEVIIDPHRISLPSDLPDGEYQFRIGFYNEETNERLPLSPGVDTYTWPIPITITRP